MPASFTPIPAIKHVVVLMLENRSFDHMLGALPGVDGADPERVNGGPGGEPYWQAARDNFTLPAGFDPTHEFANVKVQLAARRDMSGFVADAHATALATVDGFGDWPPAQQRALLQAVMDHFSLGALPGLHTLARHFAVCDRWFASVPGPTWPNRFFAMMGSCHGCLRMPEGPLGAVTAVRSIAAQLGKNSIFSVLPANQHRIYTDYPTPLSALLKGANRPLPISAFRDDAANRRLPAFSWLEPNYSKLVHEANSQHPPENVLRGDALIAEVYNALRANDETWASTLLVVLYDEHGGFHDHVPPQPTIAPDDTQTDVDFDFSITGVRVPAVLVSPWIKPGAVKAGAASPVYDHTSLLAFVCDQFGLSSARSSLGRRVQAAEHFGTADIWLQQMNAQAPARIDPAPIPEDAAELASGALHDALPGLLAGLDAHADVESHRGQHGGLVMLDGSEAAARRHIADAWNRGIDGRSADDVAGMIQRVQRSFAGMPGH